MTELAFPKPRPRLDRVEKSRENDRVMAHWRQEVWRRDKGVCRCCGRKVVKSLEVQPAKGEAHHIVRRAVRATRTDVRNGLLLCFGCHEKVTHYELRVIGTKFFRVTGSLLPYIDADHPVTFKPL